MDYEKAHVDTYNSCEVEIWTEVLGAVNKREIIPNHEPHQVSLRKTDTET